MIKTKREWYSQMDGLRFVAVFFVLLEHFAYYIGHPIHAGFFGVDLFFVISGFLITEGLLIDKYSEDGFWLTMGRFYAKRFLRIFPIYYLFLWIAFFTIGYSREIKQWTFTYTLNYYPFFSSKTIEPPFDHLWSLNVEEQFYILWPFVLLLISRRFLLPLLLALFTGSIIYFLLRSDYIGLAGRMYSLCMGAILAFYKQFQGDKYNAQAQKRFLIILAAAILLFFFNDSIGLSFLSFGLVYLCSCSAFPGIFKKFLEHRSVSYFGKISYGVYLYHLPLAYFITKYIFDPVWKNINFGKFYLLNFHSWIIKFPLYTLVVLLVAHISYRFIEKPILKFKNKI